MYSRAEASRIKQNFWTAFGRYLSPHQSSEGLKINWVNYHTGYRHVYFRMEAGREKATIAIMLTQPDELLRRLFYDKLQSFRSFLSGALGEDWRWEADLEDESGRTVSRISAELSGVSIYRESDWPAIISFFKPRIIALDEVWNTIKDGFEELR